jgi:hypothetical protein
MTILYKGEPVKDMDKERLLEVIEEMYKQLEKEREDKWTAMKRMFTTKR